jgi:hypothetical protein
MNIFLDSNVFWNDPYLSKGKKAILLRLAKHEDVKLYINETVYQETLRGHKNFLDIEIKSIKDSYQKIKSYLRASREQFDVKIELENLISDFHAHFSELESEKQLEVIPYDSDVLTHLVEVDAYEKAPFIQKQEVIDKKGDKKTFSKKEIRDAIIWYSYKTFIEKNELKECFFISNNAKDFGATAAKNAPKENPYPLHPAIIEGINITAYKTIYDFMAHNDTRVKEFFKDENLHSKLLSEDFFEQIEDELKNGLAEEIIHKFLAEQIHEETASYLSGLQPDDIHQDYFMGGYIDPSMSGDISDIRFREVDIYGDTITIAADVDIEMEVDVYLYNPVHDSREDKFMFQATDTVKVEESIVFLISTDREKNLDTENFSFKDYVEGLEPDNLNIEFIANTNIHHISMFHQDDEYDPPQEEGDDESLLVKNTKFNF